MTSGVFWNAPGRVPNCGKTFSFGFHSHAIARLLHVRGRDLFERRVVRRRLIAGVVRPLLCGDADRESTDEPIESARSCAESIHGLHGLHGFRDARSPDCRPAAPGFAGRCNDGRAGSRVPADHSRSGRSSLRRPKAARGPQSVESVESVDVARAAYNTHPLIRRPYVRSSRDVHRQARQGSRSWRSCSRKSCRRCRG